MIKTILLALLATLLSLPPAIAAPFHHPFGEWREYNRDWLAACPDKIVEGSADYYGFSCFASTGSAEQNGAGQPEYKLTVLLNRLTGELDLSFSVQADGIEADRSRPLLVSFSGDAPRSYDFGSDLETRYNTVNQFYFVDPQERAALLELMRERNALMLTVPVAGGGEPGRAVQLSLRGVSASIDFMTSYARRVSQY